MYIYKCIQYVYTAYNIKCIYILYTLFEQTLLYVAYMSIEAPEQSAENSALTVAIYVVSGRSENYKAGRKT